MRRLYFWEPSPFTVYEFVRKFQFTIVYMSTTLDAVSEEEISDAISEEEISGRPALGPIVRAPSQPWECRPGQASQRRRRHKVPPGTWAPKFQFCLVSPFEAIWGLRARRQRSPRNGR